MLSRNELTLGWMTFSQGGRRLMIAEDDHFQIWNWQAVIDQLKALNLD